MKAFFSVASRMPCRAWWADSLLCVSHILPTVIKWGLVLARWLIEQEKELPNLTIGVQSLDPTCGGEN